MIVYLDGVMGLNFLVDLALLLGVNRLAGYPPGMKRAAAAAAFGGGYAGACLIPGFSFLANGLWRTVSLGLMSVTAFGTNRSAWRRGVLFVLLSMALGGLAVQMDAGNFSGIVLGGLGVGLLCQMGFRGKGGQRLIPVELSHQGETVSFLALRDTGNTLTDPVTGGQVLVASPQIAERFGLTQEELKNPAEHLRPGQRLIPYHAVGGSGFLLAMRCEEIRVDGKMQSGLVAFAPEPFPDGAYQALTGGSYG